MAYSYYQQTSPGWGTSQVSIALPIPRAGPPISRLSRSTSLGHRRRSISSHSLPVRRDQPSIIAH